MASWSGRTGVLVEFHGCCDYVANTTGSRLPIRRAQLAQHHILVAGHQCRHSGNRYRNLSLRVSSVEVEEEESDGCFGNWNWLS